MNFNMENIRIFLEQSFVVLFYEFEFPAYFSVIQNQNKNRQTKREEFLSNDEFEVTKVKECVTRSQKSIMIMLWNICIAMGTAKWLKSFRK